MTHVTKEERMKEVFDEQLKSKYMKKYQIEKIFDTPDLKFQVIQYEAGEFMSSKRSPLKYLKFIVKGTWDIYSMDKEGKTHLLKHADALTIMGDVEFFSGIETGNLQKACEEVISIELSMDKYKHMLLQDNAFLRFLCRSMTQKLINTTNDMMMHDRLEEQLIQYMRYECEEGYLTCIEEAAFRLNRSRRQLHRVLKKLVENHVICKESRGCYRLL